MKKYLTQIFSTQHIQLMVAAIFLAAAIYSCTKNSNEQFFAKESLIENAVSEWYKQISPSLQKTGTIEFADSIMNKLDYSFAKKIQLKNDTALFIVKIDDDGNIGAYLGFIENNNEYKTVGLFKAYSNYTANSIEVIEEFEKNGRLKTGEMIEISTLNNLLRKRFEGLPNGKIRFQEALPQDKLNLKLMSSGKPSLGTNQAISPLSGCIDWYWVTYVVDTGEITSAIYLYTACSGGGDEVALGNDGGVGHGGGGGTGSNTTTIIQDIKNNLKDPCLIGTLDKLMNTPSGAKEDINYILTNVFGESKKYNLTFVENPNLADNQDGHTLPAIITNGIFSFTIELNSNTLLDATKEFTAATIIHEVVHAYLRTTGKIGQLQQHSEMANGYVNRMASALIKMYPNLTTNQANAMAWGGLQDTSGWAALPDNLKNQYTIENNYQHAGNFGTKCN
jgi:hypothetical protein